VRRWQEIRLRQNRLRADTVMRNASLEQSMLKSGFTMSDINGIRVLRSLIICVTLLKSWFKLDQTINA